MTVAELTPGQRVRIVDAPTSISVLQAGRQGEYLGPHLVEEGLVYVALDSGSHLVPNVQVLLRPHDLQEVPS